MEIRVSTVELESRVTTLSTEELDLLQRCHRALFESVLKIVGPPLLKCSFHDAAANALVVPINLWQLQDPPLAYIDFEMAKRVIEVSKPTRTLEWPFPYEDAVVIKAYTRDGLAVADTFPRQGEFFEVIDVDENVTPSHEFPDTKFASYAEYFLKKYNMRISNLSQPALECKMVGFGESRLRLITSRFMDTHGVRQQDPSSVQRETENLFAEVTSLYPLPASFLKAIRCLPSMLYRLESFLSVDDLRSEVTLDTGIGRLSTTVTDLRGYRDYGLGRLKTRWDLDDSPAVVSCPCSECSPNRATAIRGPGNALLLQAVTLKSANDSIDNERLETLGDSFLKLATSVFLYCDRPDAYEGRLTSARTRRIGNLNLFRLAKHKKMIGKVISKKFVPKNGWIPPCFTFAQSTRAPDGESACTGVKADNLSDHERQYLYHRVTDKGAADFMESLIGAYLVAGGMEAALRFMKWIGIKITRRKTESKAEGQDNEEKARPSTESLRTPKSKRYRQSPELDFVCDPEDNLLVDHSPEILQHHFGPAPPSLFDPTKRDVVERLLRHSIGPLQPHQLREIVRWEFKERALLLQALTHASYQKNRVTDCYQRLEFLGDAVLDYLITTQVYERFPHFDPGKITDMRSALVNNNLFAELAVKMRLHKLLLHLSPTLFRLIPEYERFLEERPDPGKEDHNVMHDEVCIANCTS